MSRSYPGDPVCAVGAIIFRGNSVLLVQRGRPPAQGQWSIPGGLVRLGEALEAAVQRELHEETGLEVRPVEVGKVVDRIFRDRNGRVTYHYVIVDFICEAVNGEPEAGSDAVAARYVELSQLTQLDITEGTSDVIQEVYARWTRQV